MRAGADLIAPSLLLPGFALAVASSAIPYTLEMFALKRLPKNTFGILLSMEPAVGALAGLIILKEQLQLIQWTVVACIVVASIGSSMGVNSAPAEPPSAADVPADSL
jgi:inner membrane transporter RhtA